MANIKIVILVWIILLYCQPFRVNCTRLSFPLFTQLSFRGANASGAESLAFDASGGGPYGGVADGRVLKYGGPHVGFQDFATTSPLRNKTECDGKPAPKCGRVAGLGFDYSSGDLYAVDVYFGLFVVPPSGGSAIPIARGYNGTDFSLLNGLDVDQESQIVYFTDAEKIFLTGNHTLILGSNDTEGKMYKYDIKTKQITLLLSGLTGPTGLAVSKDGDYVVISEFMKKRIQRYWVKGHKSNSSEILIASLPGAPDNIKRTKRGDFWVAVRVSQPETVEIVEAIGIRFDGSGRILETLNFTSEYDGRMVTEVHEYSRKLYLASASSKFVGVFRR